MSPLCPDCGGDRFTIQPVIVARDPGTFSLAGMQLKFSADQAARIECVFCDWSRLGHLEDPVMSDDGTHFISGHFVADPPLKDSE